MHRKNMLPSINTNQGFNDSPLSMRIGSPRANTRRKVCSCGSEFGGQCVCYTKTLTPSNSISSFIKADLDLPDCNSDPALIKFGNFHDSAINLALYTLNITKQEYASISIEDLKRRFPNNYPNGYALDILIEDKKNSIGISSIFPKTISPVKRSSPLKHEIKLNSNLNPDNDELDNLVNQSYHK